MVAFEYEGVRVVWEGEEITDGWVYLEWFKVAG